MIKINNLTLNLQKQLLKATYSIIVASIIITILYLLPKNDSAEVSLTLKLKRNVLMLEYISSLKTKKLTIEEFLTSEANEADKIILGSTDIIKNCSMKKVNGQYLIGATLRKFTVEYNILTNKNVNLDTCTDSIVSELNSITREWISRLIFSLNYIKSKEKSKLDTIRNDELLIGEDKLGILLLDAMQNMTNTNNVKHIQADIDILTEYLEENDYYNLINPNLQYKGTRNLTIQFISIFSIFYILLNARLLITALKKY